MKAYRALLVCLAVAAASIPLACGSGGETQSGHSGTGASTATSTGGSGGKGGGSGGEGGCVDLLCGQQVESMTIDPPDPVIEVVNGVIPPPLGFVAVGHVKGGGTMNVAATWSYDRPDVANLNTASGAFSATGLTGGKGTITAKYGAFTATTTATVKLHFTDEPLPIDPTVKGQFGTASTPDPALAWLYPYDKTVFPRGLLGPTIQWNGGGAADVYYVHASASTFEYEAWTTVPPPSRYAFPSAPTDIWKKLTDSAGGSDVTVSIQRHDGSQAYLPTTQTWKIAPANLAGTIYFWEVNNGNVVRIKPGDSAPSDFLIKPAGVSCVACHSVSKNGSTLVASFHGGWSPWGTFEAATGNSLYNSNLSSGFQAISPDGQFVLWRHWNDGNFGSTGFLTLSKFDDATSLAQLNPGVGAPAHPTWSGDGSKISFSVRTNGNGLDFTQSTLWITDVDLQGLTFGNTHEIITNDAARPTVTFPTFGPDSKWIAFERSTQARSRGAQSDIWLTSADGSTVIPLDAANGSGKLMGAEASSNYEPTFMPVASGGYFWLVIVSERTYGNTLTDLNPNSRHKQLWVTAIDASPLPGQDPSHPAFWLPGQDVNNNNMRGEWALSPCKMLGDTCSAGYECCDGFCHDDGTGTFTCDNQMMGCSQIGEACITAADCCDPGALCVGGFCAKNVPN